MRQRHPVKQSALHFANMKTLHSIRSVADCLLIHDLLDEIQDGSLREILRENLFEGKPLKRIIKEKRPEINRENVTK